MKKIKQILLKHYNELLIVLILVAVAISWFFWGYDNFLEEAVEKGIEVKTGQDIDLSPFNGDPDSKD